MRPSTLNESGLVVSEPRRNRSSSLGSSSLGTLLGAEADTHDAADDAADDAAADADEDDDQDDDASGNSAAIDVVALSIVADVGVAFKRASAFLAVAPGAYDIVVAHF